VDHGRDDLSGVQQGLSSQMSVTLCRPRLSMPKQVLDMPLFTRKSRREDVPVRGTTGTDRSKAMAAALSAMTLGLPDFETGTSKACFSRLHVLPFGLGDLTAAGADEQQKQDRFCSDLIFVRAGSPRESETAAGGPR
jgi:hypothetical protein